MLVPLLALKVTPLGSEVNDRVPFSTARMIEVKLVSLSATNKSLLPVKSMAVLTAVTIDVVAVELMAVPPNWLIGASLAPVTVIVKVLVRVALLVSLTS